MGVIRKRIRQFLYVLVNIRTYLYLLFYKFKNHNSKKLFVYTDSRGFEISQIKNRKSPFSSYLSYLVKNYNCDVFICPEKHTTVFDFLYKYQKLKHKKYHAVIAHIGVVDFSPRPASQIEGILNLKKNKIENCFDKEFFYQVNDIKIYPEQYMNEDTTSLLPTELINKVAEEFNKIDDLIWITCNPVDLNWRGNYKRDRPVNINVVNDKSIVMKGLLSDRVRVIDFTKFSMEEVHKYTCDNIHMSPDGMKLIENELKKIV
ncbi:SGNH/GDSL hydrolase family protein [Aquimarina sp. Aq107]|uniref:SGNH/GDSL hydrolase family protein n=1 Tax=Aquimarina sp. Aq107 TaxID=1191912 RepID=UPI000D560856|nr:SGNH/GDSL hydrolase family protein [Aquimarina sp. Aq107]